MSTQRLFARCVAGLMFAVVCNSAAPQIPHDPTPREVLHRSENPWQRLPAEFAVSGVLTDPGGSPIAGVAIDVDGETVAISGDDGGFSLTEALAPSAIIHFRHPDYADLHRAAGFLWTGGEGPAEIALQPLAEQFHLTPAGGRFSGGGITLEVPAGAVDRPVTVRAGRLPLDLAYADGADLQLQRLGAVEFAPAGLRFNHPVSVTVDLSYGSESGEGRVLLFDPASGEFRSEAGVDAVVEADRATFTISHFSRRAVADPASGIVRKHIDRTNDINGDGVLTSEDADFTMLLSGGSQTAEFTISTESATTVSQASEAGRAEGSSSTASAGGGVQIGGAGIDVKHTVSKERSTEIVRRAGLEATSASSSSSTHRLHAPEYQLQCKYYTGIYDFYRVEVWKKHEPSDVEMAALKEAYANRTNPDREWSYFVWNRPTGIAINRTLHGENHLAIRQGDGGLEVYRLADTYVVKRRFATLPADCKPGDMQKRIDEAVKGETDSGKAASNMKDNFRFFGGGNRDAGYMGWGLLPETDIRLVLGQECGNESEGEYIIRSSLDRSREEERRKGESTSATTEATAGGGAGYGPISVSAEVSAATGTSSASSEVESYARNVMSAATTRVHWLIHDAHQHHYSDHLVAPLHNVMRVGGRDIKRPIGVMVVRYNEYPCAPRTPGATPAPLKEPEKSAGDRPLDESGDGSSDGRLPPADASAPPATPQGPSQSSAGEGAEDSAEAASGVETIDHINVVFTELEGTSTLNGTLIGQPTEVEVIGLEPDAIPEGAVAARKVGDTIEISVRETIPADGITVRGSRADVTITALEPEKGDSDEAAQQRRRQPEEIFVLGGLLVSVAGVMEGTLDLPVAVTESGGPDDFGVTLGGQPVTAVARHDNQLAFHGSGITPPASGVIELAVTSPSGNTVSSPARAWFYSIDPQPVTHVGVWAAITMTCSGLDENPPVEVVFTPLPGQTIEPERVTVSCPALAGGGEIARYKTSVAGQQPLNIHVAIAEK